MRGNTIYITRIDHGSLNTCIHSILEGGKKIFPQLPFRNPGWGTVLTGFGHRIPQVMLHTGSYFGGIVCELIPLVSFYHSPAQGPGKIYILSKGLPKTRPYRLSAQTQHR